MSKDDFTMIDYSKSALPDVGTMETLTGWLGGVTIKEVIALVVILYIVRVLFQHKKVMGEVRQSLLTPHGIISGAIHAIIAVGLWRVIG